MRRRLAILATMLSVSACGGGESSMGGPPAHAYRNWDDWFVAASGLPLPWRPYPCTVKTTERFRGESFDVLSSKPTDECVYMTPPQRWRGLWRNDFEGSGFCPNARTECSYWEERPRIWLDAWPKYPPDQKLYRVEFIGRRTMFLGAYGHLGMSDHYMKVDRMISMKEVQWPPRSKAEIERQWRACQGLGLCMSPKDLEAMHE